MTFTLGTDILLWDSISQDDARKYKIELHYQMLDEYNNPVYQVIETKNGTTRKPIEPTVPLSQLEKIIDDARYAEDIEVDLCELVNELKKK